MHYTISIEPEASAENETILAEGLATYNATLAADPNRQEVSILLRDSEGGVVGGLSGAVVWDWLFISLIWVSEQLRGHGYGRSLMAAAEREALAHGCTSVYLHTFQARGFYERLGYEVFGQLEDFPPGYTRYFLRKRNLTAPSTET